jgi:hypothetical protein
VVTEDDVLAFVRDAIRSIWTLELLVLMQRDADRAWRAEEIATTLRANMRVALEGLTALERVALVQVDGNGLVRYRPASPMLAETVRQVVELYARKPLAVVKTIHASPTGKIQTLADAFRFGR